jgi:glucose-1-phosphate thymidylyltransferase
MKIKGIVLAGGSGTRLYPLTKALNKHVLPVYDRPMIYYPIQSLVQAGITDIILVAGGNHIGQFIDLLGDGSELGCTIDYVVQSKPGGIAEALSLTQPHVGDNPMVVILGDNIFMEDITPFVEEFKKATFGRFAFDKNRQCHVVCSEVKGSEAVNYGVLSHGQGDEEQNKSYGQTYITEKPKFPLKEPDKLFKAVTGLYMYTPDVFKMIGLLEPSDRGELEVSDLNDMYASTGDLTYSITSKLWLDCGVSIDHMLECGALMKINKLREL